MRKRKTIIIAVSLLCICVISIIFVYNNIIEKDIILLDAKSDGFHSFNELDVNSPIIIKGKKIDEVGTNIFKSKINNKIVGGYTKSKFEITEVFKNSDNNSRIQLNQSIIILEHSFKNMISNKIYTVNGYKNMTKGDEYLLFLNNEEEGLFAIRGVIFGKIPLNKTSEIYENYLDSGFIKEYNAIIDKAKQKYIN